MKISYCNPATYRDYEPPDFYNWYIFKEKSGFLYISILLKCEGIYISLQLFHDYVDIFINYQTIN